MYVTLASVLCGILSMLGFGVSSAMSKQPITEIGVLRTLLIRNLFISFFLAVAVIFTQPKFSLPYMMIATAISVLAYLPVAALFKALHLGKVGVITPIANSSVVFTVLFSIIFFGENVSKNQFLGIMVTLSGIILISINFHDFLKSDLISQKSGVPYALLTSLLWGLVFFLFKIPITVLGPILTAFITELGIMIWSALHLKITKQNVFKPIPLRTFFFLFAVAIFGTMGTLFYNIGISITSSISIVAAIAFSSPLVAAIYGHFFYHDTLSKTKWAAIGLIVAGLVLVIR